MARQPRHDPETGERLRKVLLVAGVLLSGVSLALYLHALSDGTPTGLESLRPRAEAVDPFALMWFPTAAGTLLVVGAATRLRFAWVGLAAIAIFGTYYFLGFGWPYLLAAVLLAALAGQIPPRVRTAAPERT